MSWITMTIKVNAIAAIYLCLWVDILKQIFWRFLHGPNGHLKTHHGISSWARCYMSSRQHIPLKARFSSRLWSPNCLVMVAILPFITPLHSYCSYPSRIRI